MRIPNIPTHKRALTLRAITRAVCAVTFVAFCVLCLCFYQGGLLLAEVAWLIGKEPCVGAVAMGISITALLFLLSRVLRKRTIDEPLAEALPYALPLTLLLFVTDVGFDLQGTPHFRFLWLITAAVMTAFWLLRTAKTKQKSEREAPVGRAFLVKNFALLLAMIYIVALLGNNDEALHYRLKMETLLLKGKADEALRVGKRSQATNGSLTMLRVYALSLKGKLPESLFRYELKTGGISLLPDKGQNHCLIINHERITSQAESTEKSRSDYLLTGLLLSKDLPRFYSQFIRRRHLYGKRIPKPFREAMLLYRRTRSAVSLPFKDPALEADFDDMRSLKLQYKSPKEYVSRLKEAYGNTYWCYYLTH